jgi:23S rRNA pseudouridine1911/1915/1917 synthase
MRWKITDQAGTRLDVAVVQKLPNLSRTSVGRLIDDGKVTVNKAPTKVSQKLRIGDTVVVDYDPTKAEEIPEIDLPIIYEDDDCVVINKPLGLLTHSKGAFNPEATVATWVRGRVRDLDGERAGIVHRLDRATSGVMIVAKSPTALSWLQKQFSLRKVKKTYIAVVVGELKPSEAVIDMPIERNPKAPATFRVGPNGKKSTTTYKVLKTSGGYSLVELQPQTGRTHQLRVHLKQLGHPIVGDTLYGGQSADRLLLHAKSLEITLPNRERTVFNAPVPKAFEAIMKQPS